MAARAPQLDSTARFRDVATEMGFDEDQILGLLEAARELTRRSITFTWHDALSDVLYRVTQGEDPLRRLWAEPAGG